MRSERWDTEACSLAEDTVRCSLASLARAISLYSCISKSKTKACEAGESGVKVGWLVYAGALLAPFLYIYALARV